MFTPSTAGRQLLTGARPPGHSWETTLPTADGCPSTQWPLSRGPMTTPRALRVPSPLSSSLNQNEPTLQKSSSKNCAIKHFWWIPISWLNYSINGINFIPKFTQSFFHNHWKKQLQQHLSSYIHQKLPPAPEETNGQFKWDLFLTIPRHIKFHQLHEVCYFWREPLNFIITKSKLS